MRIQPLHDRLLVRRAPSETRTPGGLHLPPGAEDTTGALSQGEVLVAGPGSCEDGCHMEMVCHAGDVVLFGKYAGSKVEVDGEELLLIRQAEVFATVHPE